MIVVSDNGPVAFLIQIRRIEILVQLYGQVVIPPAVHTELLREQTPSIIRDWFAAPPRWIEVRSPNGLLAPGRSGLGEREAIQLAIELSAPLLCDDRQATSQAKRSGLVVTGTLGVLQVAHARGLIEIEDAIEDLRVKTDFRLPVRIPEAILPEIVNLAHQMRSRVAL